MGFLDFIRGMSNDYEKTSSNSNKKSDSKTPDHQVIIHRERVSTVKHKDGDNSKKETAYSKSTYDTRTGKNEYKEGWHGHSKDYR